MSRPRHRRRRLLRTAGWLASLGVAGAAAGALLAAGGAARPFAIVPPLAALALWHRILHQPGAVPVLMYHSVSADSAWLPWAAGICVTPETFERHLSLLDRHGYRVIPTRDLLAARREGRSLPAKTAVLHFDDGYLDNWVAAFPSLLRHQMPAAIFVTLDFIEPGEKPRPHLGDVEAGRARAADLVWDGYLNWGELKALRASGLIEIGAHGADHGRVETGPRVVGEVSPANWRRLAWVQWAAMPGPKWDWHRHPDPPAVPYGTAVRESAPSLGSRAWRQGRLETQEAYEARVRDELARCRSVLERELGGEVSVFCWPQHGMTQRAHEIAREVGYLATAAGDAGENRPGDPPDVIYRVHSGERIWGFPWGWGDDLAFLAKLRVHAGNYSWVPVLLAAHGVRKALAWTRSRRTRATATRPAPLPPHRRAA